MNYLLFFLLSFSAFAETVDQRLAGYIQQFNLKPLHRSEIKNERLYKLGLSLFMDRVLSGNNNISCMECHHHLLNTTDSLPLGLGEGAQGISVNGNTRRQKNGEILPRNTPALHNLEGVTTLFWDGRVSFDEKTKVLTTPTPLRQDIKRMLKSALAAQAIFPIADHEEMRGKPGTNPVADAKTEAEAWAIIVQKVLAVPQYREAFDILYPGEEINIGHIGEALAEFQRVAFSLNDTAYDRYLKGDLKAMNEIQKIGMDVFFNKGKCGECHNGAHLSNFEFHSIGVPQIGPGKTKGDDLGRYQWDPRPENLYAFRVPPLRNVALSAPYMHNGTFKTLAQVVEHYDMVVESLTGYKLINNWKNYTETIADHDHSRDELRVSALSPKLTPLLHFTEDEEKALVEFLTTALTDKDLLAREIGGDYKTHCRIQLQKSGYEKLAAKFTGEKSFETYYYFDALLEGGFALRELAEPIRLFILKNEAGAKLYYREQAFKSAVASNGIVLGTTFDRQEVRDVPEEIFSPLESSYLDMFQRLYNYHSPEQDGPVPATELYIIKKDLEVIMGEMRKINFDGALNISDKMNSPKEEVLYVPTSFNTKETTIFDFTIKGKNVSANLQRSTLRNELGGTETTYAIELELQKLQKAEFEAHGLDVLKLLDLSKEDVGAGSPSPSELTLKIINEVIQ
jgi:cytochrome c peroxidase